MRDELDDHPEDCRYLTYEYWCDLMFTIKVKYERKRAERHIKKIAYAREASLSDSDESVKVPCRKKAKTGVSNSHNFPMRAQNRHHGAQHYCVIFKKSGMTEHKYASHSTEDCTGVRTKRSIKDGMGGSIGSRTHSVKQHTKSEKKMEKGAKIPQ